MRIRGPHANCPRPDRAGHGFCRPARRRHRSEHNRLPIPARVRPRPAAAVVLQRHEQVASPAEWGQTRFLGEHHAEAWTSSDQFSSDFADRSTRVTTGLATPYAAWTPRPHRATTASGSSRTSAGRKATTARPARRLATIATARARVARLLGCARTIATTAQCSCIHPRSTPGADLATTSGTRTASPSVSLGLGTTGTTGQAPRCERDSLCQHQSSSDSVPWPQRPGID